MDNGLSTQLAELVQANPLVAGALLMAVLIAAVGRRRRGAPRSMDPTRLFTSSQRSEGFARAGGRCELESIPFFRCRRKSSHGDHHYPWSKGGATSMANFTAACAKCNTSKGAKVPSWWSTQRMEARRRRYFPAGSPVKAGERFAHR